MSKYLRTRVIERLKNVGLTFVQLPPSATPHAKGVRFGRFCNGIDSIRGAMDSVKEGKKRGKRIVIRPSRFRNGLFELYTYHFPTQWSKACVENREMIKEAQRRAHAMERAYTPEAREWKIRYFKQLYTLPVWTKDCQEVPVTKRRYPHFYTFVFTMMYYEMREAAQQAKQAKELSDAEIQRLTEEVSFVPVCPAKSPYFRNSRLHNAAFHIKKPLSSPNTCISQNFFVPLHANACSA